MVGGRRLPGTAYSRTQSRFLIKHTPQDTLELLQPPNGRDTRYRVNVLSGVVEFWQAGNKAQLREGQGEPVEDLIIKSMEVIKSNVVKFKGEPYLLHSTGILLPQENHGVKFSVEALVMQAFDEVFGVEITLAYRTKFKEAVKKKLEE